MSDPDWVQICNVGWVHEANFVKSVLESEGIQVLIPDEHTLGLQPLYANALGGVRVLVPKGQFGRATELLASAIPKK